MTAIIANLEKNADVQQQDNQYFSECQAEINKFIGSYDIIKKYSKPYNDGYAVRAGSEVTILNHEGIDVKLTVQQDPNDVKRYYLVSVDNNTILNEFDFVSTLTGLVGEELYQKINIDFRLGIDFDELEANKRLADEALVDSNTVADAEAVDPSKDSEPIDEEQTTESKTESQNFSSSPPNDTSKTKIKWKPKTKFPWFIFPKSFRDMIREGNMQNYLPTEFLAAGALFIASIAIGTSVCIRLKRTWVEYPGMFIVLVAAQGQAKSPSLKLMNQPLKDKDRKDFLDYLKAKDEYNKLTDEEKKEKQPPMPKQTFIDDFTFEAFCPIMEQNYRGVGIVSDEFMGLLNTFSRYRKGNDTEVLLKIFNQETIKVNRVGKDPINIDKPFASIIGGIQWDRLRGLGGEERNNNGFLDRLLYVPLLNKPASKWNEDEIPIDVIKRYGETISRLFEINKYSREPIEMIWSLSAKELWWKWFDKMEEIKFADKGGIISRLIPKIQIYVSRFALVLELSFRADQNDCLDLTLNNEIGARSLRYAIKLGEYFLRSSQQIFDKLKNKIDPKVKRELIINLHEKGFSIRDISEIVDIPHSTVYDWIKASGQKIYEDQQ